MTTIYEWVIVNTYSDEVEKIIANTDKMKADIEAWKFYVADYEENKDNVTDKSVDNFLDFVRCPNNNFMNFYDYGTLYYNYYEITV